MLSPTKESEYVHSCFILLDGLYSSHSDQLAWNHNPKSLILRARKKKIQLRVNINININRTKTIQTFSSTDRARFPTKMQEFYPFG